jgi:4-carboxymuconolactone decarboxylase
MMKITPSKKSVEAIVATVPKASEIKASSVKASSVKAKSTTTAKEVVVAKVVTTKTSAKTAALSGAKLLKGKKNATYQAGLKVRSEVLGKAYVEQRIAEADVFTADLQHFVNEHAWGAVWTRPGLSRKIRSLLVLAMTTAMNRPHELEIHVRGALNNGVTMDEMKELFLQAAVYAGAPAALDGFRVAKKVLIEQGKL